MKVPVFSTAGAGKPEPMDIKQEQMDYKEAPIKLQLHPLSSRNGLLVQVHTPKAPAQETEHVPCDIVLVIDVSGSMGSDAPVPGEGGERTGFTVLDLTKHASLTILETLNDADRLGIVTFSTEATTIQRLKHMTPANKRKAGDLIRGMRPSAATNLWGGLLAGIEAFDDADKTANVPALMVLTDGMPNHMCPQAGYIPKLSKMRKDGHLPATIHTFGFGYHLRSGLLKSIAEIGSGSYAFIPDAGMIGTVFVHAVANLQTTCATEATLQLTYNDPVQLAETTGENVLQQKPEKTAKGEQGDMQLTIPLGNLQYGQSRDIFLQVNDIPELDRPKEKSRMGPLDVRASISFQVTGQQMPRSLELVTSTAEASCSLLDAPGVADAQVAYHESRSQICNFLSSLFPLGSDQERRGRNDMTAADRVTTLGNLIAKIPAQNFPDDQNQALMEDLTGVAPKGQISLAIVKADYFEKWGQHYLPSYLNAHTRQVCNSFKDSGPLQYGVDSPLFIACRDRLDDAFDSIKPPKPSSQVTLSHGRAFRAPSSMSSYRNVSGVCFAGSTPVELASGRTVEIRKLRRGVKVRTPAGPRKVAMVLKTKVKDETLCRVGTLLVTPWHPLSVDGKAWSFPADMADGAVLYTGSIYSVLLQRDGNSDAHAMRVAGTWGVTLGHGVILGTDARAHAYFGDYARVAKGLVKLGVGRDGVVKGGGVVRGADGLVKGFKGRGVVVKESGGGRVEMKSRDVVV